MRDRRFTRPRDPIARMWTSVFGYLTSTIVPVACAVSPLSLAHNSLRCSINYGYISFPFIPFRLRITMQQRPHDASIIAFKLTQSTPVIPVHISIRIRRRTRSIRHKSVCKHTLALGVERSDKSTPDPIPPVVDLKCGIRVPVIPTRHPRTQPLECGPGDTPRQLMLGGIFDVY